MPWSVADVDRFRKDLSPADKEKWVTVANAVRDEKLAGGATEEEADAAAVIAANAALKDQEQESLGARIVHTLYEGASPRVMMESVAVGVGLLVGLKETAPHVKTAGLSLLEALGESVGGAGAPVTPEPYSLPEATLPAVLYTVNEAGQLVVVNPDGFDIRESGALVPMNGG